MSIGSLDILIRVYGIHRRLFEVITYNSLVDTLHDSCKNDHICALFHLIYGFVYNLFPAAYLLLYIHCLHFHLIKIYHFENNYRMSGNTIGLYSVLCLCEESLEAFPLISCTLVARLIMMASHLGWLV